MTQAQSTARRRLNEIFAGPFERLGRGTIDELRTLKRKANSRKEHTFSMEEQVKIEVCYEMIMNPGSSFSLKTRK